MRTLILAGLVLAFLSLSPGPVLAQSEALTTAQRQGMALVKAGQHGKAAPFLKKALELSEREIGPDSQNTVILLNILAVTYKHLGRYAEAETLFKRSQPILEKKLGPDHMVVGRGLDNLAALYSDQGRYAEAEPLMKRAGAIFEKTHGPEHPDVATNLNNLAQMYQKQGRYDEAEPLQKRALAIWEKVFGPNHPSVAMGLGNLGSLYLDQDRHAEVEPLFKRSLVIMEKTLGKEHPNIAQALNHLATLYKGQGRYAEAEQLWKRARVIWEKALGPDRPVVVAVRKKLAALNKAQGPSPAKSLPLNQIPMYGNVEKTPELKRADEKLFSDVLKTGISLEKAAEKLANRGWEALKKEDARTAIKRFNQSWLLDPNNGNAYWGFAVILDVRDKDTSGATEMFERAHELQPKNPRLLSDYGSFLEKNGRPKKAIEVLRRAISINEKTSSAYEALVKSYLALKDTKTALRYAQLGKKFGAPIDDRLLSDLKTAAVPGGVTRQNVDQESLAEVLSLRAVANLLQHKYDQAIKDADRAIHLKPDYVDAFAIRARAYSEMGQYDRAIKDAGNILRLEPDYAEAFAIRAGAYNGKRLYDRAIADADRALGLKPDMDMALRNKASALNGLAWKLATVRDENERNGQQAVRLAEEAKRLNADEPYIHGTLAAAYAATGRFADAIAEQERAISMLRKAGRQNESAEFQSRLDLYRQNKPYRQ